MKSIRRVSMLLILALCFLLPVAQAATPTPVSVSVSAASTGGSASQLAEYGCDAIIDMANGTRLSLSALVQPSGADQRVTWSSSSTAIATVSSSGIVTARKRGTVTIKAVARGNKKVTDTFVLRIIDSSLPDQIILDASDLSLYRFDTYQLHPVVLPATATRRDVAYKTSRSSVVSVSKTGLITAKKAGTAIITCYSTSDKTVLDTVTVTVTQKPNPTSITLSPDTTAVVVGSTLQLTPSYAPWNACDYFTWKSSSTRIATVSEDGFVTFHRTGKVTITCTSRQTSRVKATRTILVVSPDSPLSIQTPSDNYVLAEGSTMSIDAVAYPLSKSQSFTYKSSRTSVVTVDANGLLIAKQPGSATITITSAVNRDLYIKIPVTVKQLPAPTSLSLSPVITKLAVGNTLQLTATPYPSGSSPLVTWKTSKSSVASISSTGLVTARSVGTVTFTAVSKRNSKVLATITLNVYDEAAPTSISLGSNVLALENTQTYALTPVYSPLSSKIGVTYQSSNTSVASVTSAGVVTGKSSGTAIITATSKYNPSVSTSVKVTVTNKTAPTSIVMNGPAAMMTGETFQLMPTTMPSTASQMFSYTTSSSTIATISPDGLITARKEGTVTITVRATKKTSVRTSFTLRVYSETTPKSVSLSVPRTAVAEESSTQLVCDVQPATAYQKVAWSSSNSAVATVSSTGLVTGHKAGTATITCQTLKGDLKATCQVTVLTTTLSTVIPARTTDIAGIPENLAKIDALRKSALKQISVLKNAGSITSSEATLRQEIINRAFAMQSFPWMTLNTQEYWSKSYAYKRYLPGFVYYGLPYIQTSAKGTYTNRRYDVTRALNENRYTATANGYYMLNQNNLLENMYVGNDCSAFVSMAQWGTSHAASFYNTTSIASTTYYKNVSYNSLRPGDLLVKSGSHTVLFLYYTNTAKTKMMIIEQGGNGNTIICSEFDVSNYQNQGYVPRRRATFN